MFDNDSQLKAFASELIESEKRNTNGEKYHELDFMIRLIFRSLSFEQNSIQEFAEKLEMTVASFMHDCRAIKSYEVVESYKKIRSTESDQLILTNSFMEQKAIEHIQLELYYDFIRTSKLIKRMIRADVTMTPSLALKALEDNMHSHPTAVCGGLIYLHRDKTLSINVGKEKIVSSVDRILNQAGYCLTLHKHVSELVHKSEKDDLKIVIS